MEGVEGESGGEDECDEEEDAEFVEGELRAQRPTDDEDSLRGDGQREPDGGRAEAVLNREYGSPGVEEEEAESLGAIGEGEGGEGVGDETEENGGVGECETSEQDSRPTPETLRVQDEHRQDVSEQTHADLCMKPGLWR